MMIVGINYSRYIHKMERQNRKKRAASRIESIRSKLNSGDTRIHLQTFITEYFLCEMASKEMLVGYKESIGEAIKYEEAKMDLRVLKPAFNHYRIGIGDDVRNCLFSSSQKSAKKIRDPLVHGISKKNLELLNQQYTQISADMRLFLNLVLEKH